MQSAVGIDGAAGHDVGRPGKRFNGKQGVSRSGGEQLDVRGGHEQAAFVQAVELLAVGGDDADAELGVAHSGVGENGVDAIGKRGMRPRGPGRFCL